MYEFENCTQRRLDLWFAAAGFAFGSSFAPAFFVAFFPLLPALSICVTTAAVSSASATLGVTFSYACACLVLQRDGREGGCWGGVLPMNYLLRAILAWVRGGTPPSFSPSASSSSPCSLGSAPGGVFLERLPRAAEGWQRGRVWRICYVLRVFDGFVPSLPGRTCGVCSWSTRGVVVRVASSRARERAAGPSVLCAAVPVPCPCAATRGCEF